MSSKILRYNNPKGLKISAGSKISTDITPLYLRITSKVHNKITTNSLQNVPHKVNRCLARYSPRTTTDQPTNRAPNEQARPGKNANFGPNLVVPGQKILIFTGEIKSFVTYIPENPPRHLLHIGFWSGIGQNVQKMAIFGPK